MSSLGETEKAVLVLLDPLASQALKQSAVSFLQARKADPAFYKEVVVTLSNPNVGLSLQLMFFYLQTLEEYAQVEYAKATVDEKRNIREFLERVAVTNIGSVAGEVSLMNKFALLYARVLIHDFPQAWPTAITTLVALCNSSQVYRMLLLSVLQMVHEEAIDDETRSPTVNFARGKQLRGIFKDQVLPIVLPLWIEVLSGQIGELKTLTLSVCSRYIGLLPLPDVLTLLPLILAHINSHQIQVLHCVQSLIRKAMTTEQKLELIRELGIIGYLQRVDFKAIDDEGSDVFKALAMVVNALGVQLVDCNDRTWLWDVLSLSFSVFSSSQPLVSRVVFEFFRSFSHSLKIKSQMTPPEPLNPQELAAVGQICMALMERAKVPSGFAWRSVENSDEEDQFYIFRDDLGELFKDIMKLETTKGPVLELVAGRIVTALETPDTSPEVFEALLFLLYHFSDCLTDLHQILTSDSSLSRIFRMILTSALPRHPSPLVLRTLFDLGVRLASFFDSVQNEQLIGVLVTPLLAMMRSEDAEASGYAVKRVIGLVIKAQRPMLRHAQEIFETAERVIDRGSLDTLSLSKLFKTLGLLLGNPVLSDEFKFTRTHHLSQVLLTNCTPGKLQQLSELLSGIGRRGNAEFQANLLSLFTYIVDRLTASPLTTDSCEAVASLTHRFAICLETTAAPICERVLYYMSDYLSIEVADCLMKLISNLAQNCLSSITEKPISAVTALMVRDVPTPQETVSDHAQDIIVHRRNFIKMTEALATKGVDLMAAGCFVEMVEYIRSIVSNPFEAIVTPTQSGKIAIVIFSKLLYSAALSAQPRVHTPLLLSRALEAASVILYSPAMRYPTGETSVILQEISNIHRVGFVLAQSGNEAEEFFRYLEKVIAREFLEEYTHLIKVTEQYRLGDPECMSQANGQLNLLKNLLVRMLDVMAR